MQSKTSIYVIMILSLMCLLGSSVMSCDQAPKAAEAPVTVPAEAPATAPVEMPVTAPVETPATTTSDISTMSEEEVCVYIWKQLPVLLPNEYDITQFSKDSREAAYKGDGKWTFYVSGSMSDIAQLPLEIVEKAEDYWVERKNREVTTCDLILTAFFYEKTNLIEIVGVQRSNVTTQTEVEETPIKKEFTLDWMTVTYMGTRARFQGSIRNHGRVPLKNLGVKFFLVDEEDNVVETVEAIVEPDIIAPGENGKIYEELHTESMLENLRYAYEFLTAAGEPFEMVPAPEGAKPKFYHVGGGKGKLSSM